MGGWSAHRHLTLAGHRPACLRPGCILINSLQVIQPLLFFAWRCSCSTINSFTTATRHKHEIEYTLRHWATPVERARVEDRLGSLMRIGMRLRELRDAPTAGPTPEPMPAA